MIDIQDKSTVISLFPLPISAEKPGIFPGVFRIEASNGEPSLLVVGQSTYYVDVGEDRPQLTVHKQSAEIARSIVEDFITAQLGIDDEKGIRPGLAWVRGEFSLLTLKAKHSKLLADLRSSHKAWNMELVKLADDDWQRYHKHTVISDIQRIAARQLGYADRDWLIVEEQLKSSNCPGCGTPVVPTIVVCPSCRCILDKVKYDQMAFAK